MTTQPAPYVFEGSSINTIRKDDGSIWFVATDVAKSLGYRDAHQAVRIIDDDEQGYTLFDTHGGQQRMLIVNESGLYHLAFRSKKEAAKRFRRWVTDDVVPSIRRHGGYVVGMEKLSPAQHEQTIQLVRQEVQRVGGVNAAEEREARRMGFRALKGKRTAGMPHIF